MTEAETRALDEDREVTRQEFFYLSLQTFLLYLYTYEMPIDRVRLLLDKVESQALRDFPDLLSAGVRAHIARDACLRLVEIESAKAVKALAANGEKS